MKTNWWMGLAGTVLVLLTPGKVGATGACTAARFHDWPDMGCNQNYGGAGGVPKAKCPPCDGMPRWWVSEPYINLCMSDTPLSYTLSSGQPIDFTFYYRQRTRMPRSDEVPSYGAHVRGSLLNTDAYPRQSVCGTNASWEHNWNMSVMFWDAQWENAWAPPIQPSYAVFSHTNYEALVFRPEGGLDYYYITNNVSGLKNLQSQVRLEPVSSQGYPATKFPPTADTNRIYWGDTDVGVKLMYPDGSQDVFGLTAIVSVGYLVNFADSTIRAFLTQRIDPQGRVTRVGYEYTAYTNFWKLSSPYTPSYYAWRIKYVVDPDGRTNTFVYCTNTPTIRCDNLFQLAEIKDSYGRKVSLGYQFGVLRTDNNGPILNTIGFPTNITDAAGMTTAFQYLPGPWVSNSVWDPAQGKSVVISNRLYASSGWITNMTTPYGPTTFTYYEALDDSVIDGIQQRAMHVSEPEGVGQLYYYLHNGSGLLAATATSPADIPGQTGFDDGTTGTNHPSLAYRNSIHWGRRPFEALSSNVQSSLPSNMSNALASLTANDFRKGRVRNWLWQSDNISISELLGSERDPSPDAAGQVEGLRTWYNYIGKSAPETGGSNPQIACVARVLPDGSSQYITYNYYPVTMVPGFPPGAGLVSDSKASYARPDGTVGVLTNWYAYAGNSVDLVSVSNSAGQVWTLGYNTSHQIISVTNALNQVAALSWDGPGGNLSGVQWFGGQSASVSYGGEDYGRLQTVTWLPGGRSFTVNAYTNGLPHLVTDDRSVTVLNTWDGLNRLTGTVFPDGTSVSNLYHRLDLVGTKDRLGNWTRYQYDGLQHLTAITNANNAVTLLSWCGCGAPESILDALTNLTSLNYDNQGNLTNIVYPDNTSLTYQFDLAGRMTNAFDGAGRSVRLRYNNQDQVTNASGAYGSLLSIVYDALNRPISETDANGVTVSNTFDILGELVERTWIGSGGGALAAESFGYANGFLIAHTNQNNQVTRYGRDAAGRLIAVTNANNEVVRAAYDSLNNITNLVDGLNHTTTWQYNEYGWLTNKVDGLNRNAFRYAYNANGWLTNRWTPEKGNTGYTFDYVGNLKSILYPQSSILYSYDALNRLTNMVDAAGTTVFRYTPAGRLQSEDGPWANDGVTNTYAQSLRTAMSLAQPGGVWPQSYGYDSMWRMTNITSPAGAFSYIFGGASSASALIKQISLPNGAYITNSFDALARLTQTALNNHWGHTLDGYSYQFDPLGLRTNITRNLGLTSSSVSVGYDNIGQITSWLAQESGSSARLNERLGFGYDAAHNLALRTNGGLRQTFTVDAANQLTNVTRSGTFTASGATPAPAASVTVNGQAAQTYDDFTFAATNLSLANGQNLFANIAVNAYGVRVTNIFTVNLPQGVALAFDNNGNLTNDGMRSFAYDSENQLTNVTVTGRFKKDFVFDGLHRLRIKREFSWSGSAWVQTNEVRFIYDRNVILQHRDSNNAPTLTLTRGLDLGGKRQRAGGIGGLLAMTEASGASSYFHADALGNVTALMDASENIAGRHLYGPFGNTLFQGGAKAGINPYWFSSQLSDADTGLAHFLRRDYAPELQRWSTPDPIGVRGGINLYRANRNNPLRYVDPWGLFGGEADANPGGVNGVPYMNIGYDPSSGAINVNNNDSADAISAAILAGGAFTAAAAALLAPELAADIAAKLLGLKKPDPCKDKDNLDKLRQEGQDLLDQEKQLEKELDQAFENVAKAEDSGNLEQIDAARRNLKPALENWRAYWNSMDN